MPPSSAHTLDSAAQQAPTYQKLWKTLTKLAVEPAMSSHLSKTNNHPSRRKRQGGRSLRNKAFGNKEFVQDWSTSIHELMKAHRKQHNKKSVQRNRNVRRSSSKRKGGFIRGGSIQYFPATDECRTPR